MPKWVTVNGILTEDGKFEVELPEGWIPGDVTVEVKIEKTEPTWTDEELDDAQKFEGKTLGEITTGGWEHLEIEDSVDWVNEQRRKMFEERRNRWTE